MDSSDFKDGRVIVIYCGVEFALIFLCFTDSIIMQKITILTLNIGMDR